MDSTHLTAVRTGLCSALGRRDARSVAVIGAGLRFVAFRHAGCVSPPDKSRLSLLEKGLEPFRAVFGIERLFDVRAFAQKALL
jgi:hypothetical protein